MKADALTLVSRSNNNPIIRLYLFPIILFSSLILFPISLCSFVLSSSAASRLPNFKRLHRMIPKRSGYCSSVRKSSLVCCHGSPRCAARQISTGHRQLTENGHTSGWRYFRSYYSSNASCAHRWHSREAQTLSGVEERRCRSRRRD